MNEVEAYEYAQKKLVEAVSDYRTYEENPDSASVERMGKAAWRAQQMATIVQALTPPLQTVSVGDVSVTGPAGGFADDIDPWVSLGGDDIPGHSLRLEYLGRGRFCLRHEVVGQYGSSDSPVTFIDIDTDDGPRAAATLTTGPRP